MIIQADTRHSQWEASRDPRNLFRTVLSPGGEYGWICSFDGVPGILGNGTCPADAVEDAVDQYRGNEGELQFRKRVAEHWDNERKYHEGLAKELRGIYTREQIEVLVPERYTRPPSKVPTKHRRRIPKEHFPQF